MLVSLAKACKNSIKNNVTGKKILNPIGGYHIENLLNIDTINSSNIYNILTNSRNYINSKKINMHTGCTKNVYIQNQCESSVFLLTP